MSSGHARMVELDVLRAIAIMIIVFSHLDYFLPSVHFATAFSVSVTLFGVGLFLFLSGYVLYLNHPTFARRADLTTYFNKRILRIFPLYWLSIGLRYVLGQHFASRIDGLVILLGLQGLLSPRLNTSLSLTADWWFIGVIVVLYSVYPLIAVLGSDRFTITRIPGSAAIPFIVMLIVPYLLLVFARRTFYVVGDPILTLYFIFVFGVAICKYDVLSKYGFLTSNATRLSTYAAVSGVSLAAGLLVNGFLVHNTSIYLVSRLMAYVNALVSNVLYLVFSLLAFCFARLLVVSSSKTADMQPHALWYRSLLLIAFSSYAIYLFFLPLLTSFQNVLIAAQLTELQIDIVQLVIGVPVMVTVAYLLQRAQNEMLSKVRRRRNRVPSPPESA
ncbi:MAG: acyltransferase family protein [Halobacteriota archaeon]